MIRKSRRISKWSAPTRRIDSPRDLKFEERGPWADIAREHLDDAFEFLDECKPDAPGLKLGISRFNVQGFGRGLRRDN